MKIKDKKIVAAFNFADTNLLVSLLIPIELFGISGRKKLVIPLIVADKKGKVALADENNKQLSLVVQLKRGRINE